MLLRSGVVYNTPNVNYSHNYPRCRIVINKNKTLSSDLIIDSVNDLERILVCWSMIKVRNLHKKYVLDLQIKKKKIRFCQT